MFLEERGMGRVAGGGLSETEMSSVEGASSSVNFLGFFDIERSKFPHVITTRLHLLSRRSPLAFISPSLIHFRSSTKHAQR
jgi:hypothetical protein